jgi:DNA-binding transcriptional LysR family regulator
LGDNDWLFWLGFASEALRRINLISWRDTKNAVLKWSGLSKPEGNDQIPRLVLDRGKGMIDLRNIETFVWVARLGNFRLVAEKLNTTQPAISARVAALEQDLGVRLFERNQRRTALTAKGIELLAFAEQMLQLRTDMVARISAPASLHGVLRLGAVETVGHTWLSALLQRIHTRYPSMTLHIEVDSTPNLRRALIAHDLDIAFQLGPVNEARIVNTPLCSYSVDWLASPRLALPERHISLTELAHWPIITSPPHTPHGRWIHELFVHATLPTAGIYSSSSIATTVRMACDGIGIAAVPKIFVQRELTAGSLVVLDTECPLPDAEVTVSYPLKPDSYLAAAVAALAHEIAQNYAAGRERRLLGTERERILEAL